MQSCASSKRRPRPPYPIQAPPTGSGAEALRYERRASGLAPRLSSFAMAFAVRPIVVGDIDEWVPLWTAYLDFYRETLDEEVTRRTFERLTGRKDGLFGFGAESPERTLVGIAHGVLHPSTWSTSPSCYLEDLFVAPNARGTGTAWALVEAVVEEARRRGATKLYWHTQEFNGPARSLYDQLATRVSFVVYERSLATSKPAHR
jgi:GNAT superfamily N-acetyltransferase